MRYHISQTNPATMSTEELTAELGGFAALAAEVAERVSLILAELRKRRQPHPLFAHPVLRFFDAIADRTLSATAAINLGNMEMIKAVLPLSRDEQERVAGGADIPVAALAPDGSVKIDDMPIHRMDTATLKRAFSPDGIRTVHEQAEMIRAEGKITRIGMITVLRDETMLKIGNQKIRPEDLRGPLAALGYSLGLARNATAKAG